MRKFSRYGRAPSSQSAQPGNSYSQSSSQSRSVLSSLPERQKRPSGLKATEVTVSVCPSNVRTHWPVEASQSRSVLSPSSEASRKAEAAVRAEGHGVHLAGMPLERPHALARRNVPEAERLVMLPERQKRPSGLKATELTMPVCPSNVRTHWPVEASQSRSVLSLLPERQKRPSGLNATEFTLSVCPSNVRTHWPVEASQSRRGVLPSHAASRKAEASVRAEGHGATRRLVCPSNVRTHWPVEASQSRSVLSLLPERQKRPSGLKATEVTLSGMPLERPHALARRSVPKSERVVLSSVSRKAEAAVRAEGHGVHCAGMPLERPLHPAT